MALAVIEPFAVEQVSVSIVLQVISRCAVHMSWCPYECSRFCSVLRARYSSSVSISAPAGVLDLA